jgi:hypothetical protein
LSYRCFLKIYLHPRTHLENVSASVKEYFIANCRRGEGVKLFRFPHVVQPARDPALSELHFSLTTRDGNSFKFMYYLRGSWGHLVWEILLYMIYAYIKKICGGSHSQTTTKGSEFDSR